MGTYYTIVNHTKRERIDSVRIIKADYKFTGSAYGRPGQLMAYAMHARWRGDHVEVLSDGVDHDGEREYADVTAELAAEFNGQAPFWAEKMAVKP